MRPLGPLQTAGESRVGSALLIDWLSCGIPFEPRVRTANMPWGMFALSDAAPTNKKSRLRAAFFLFVGAGHGVRTRDLNLGKVAL